MNRNLSTILGLYLLVPVACDRQSAPSSAVTHAHEGQVCLEQLLHGLAERLAIMHDVARVKWNTQAPIHDPERERLLLEDVVEQARNRQLDSDFARSFFTAQFEAARLIQEEDFRQWRAEKRAPFTVVPSLPSLRQRIDTLNRDLVAALVQARPFLDMAEGQQQLDLQAGTMLADVPGPVRDGGATDAQTLRQVLCHFQPCEQCRLLPDAFFLYCKNLYLLALR